MFYFFALVAAVFISNAQARLNTESIIGGVGSEQNEFPYQISLQKDGSHNCGGAIIGEQYVLTAAHCVIDDEDEFVDAKFTVLAGISYLTDNTTTRVEIDVAKAYVSALYNGTVLTPIGDIAVLKLEKKFDLGPDSGLAKLPLPLNTKLGLNAKNSLATKEAVIAGFGWDKVEIKTVEMKHVGKFQIEEGSSSGKLLKAKARILANNVCQRYFVFAIQDSELCANIVEHDKKVAQGVCNGDSGGPLVSDGKLVGIVSYNGIGCNDSKRPAVYTRVSAYIDLIENAQKDITTDMRSYNYQGNSLAGIKSLLKKYAVSK